MLRSNRTVIRGHVVGGRQPEQAIGVIVYRDRRGFGGGEQHVLR